MQTVITEKQAREITGGRKPLVPIQYEEACKLLAECETLDEAKYWDNKADALAAWAKIYHDDKASLSAKRIKLKAYRRLGELAQVLRPSRLPSKGVPGFQPGASSLLREQGLSDSSARTATTLARMDEKKFQSIVDRPSPPSPKTAATVAHGSESWQKFRTPAFGLRGFFRSHAPCEVARSLPPREIAQARAIAVEIMEMLDTFEQCLPKSEG